MLSQNKQPNISLYFCIPNKLTKKVRVEPHLIINSLLTFFKINKSEYSFVYDGKVFDGNLTFNDIGITENNVLFAVENITKANLNLQNLTNSSSFRRKIMIMANNKLKNQCDRIDDIRYLKIEGSSKLYKKKMHRLYLKESVTDDYEVKSEVNYNYEISSEPCADPMPILW